MPLNFPDTPSLNQVYTSGANSWIWDGTVWNAISSSIVGINGATGSAGATGATGAAGPTGATGTFNTTTQTIDFSKDINEVQFDVYTTTTGIVTIAEAVRSQIENLVGITAVMLNAGETMAVVGTVSGAEWYMETTMPTNVSGYLTMTVKPPFYGITTNIPYTAEEILSLNITKLGDAFPAVLWDAIGITGSVSLLHKEETYALKSVTGQSWVAADTFISCKVLGLTTNDHDPEDAILEGVRFEINNIVAGTGFDIIGHAPDGTYGKYKVKCLGQ